MKYCPKCRTEYENWVNTCADCGVPLVYNLPPEEKPEPPVNYVKIYTTYSVADVTFLKSLLEASGIEYFVKNEEISQFIVGLGEYSDKEILVVEDKAEEARELLKDFLKRKKTGIEGNEVGPERMGG